MINIVRTKGKAGDLVWKLAGGQGDHDINLPWGSFVEFKVFFFFGDNVSVANPFSYLIQKFILTKTKKGWESFFYIFSKFSLERSKCIHTYGIHQIS